MDDEQTKAMIATLEQGPTIPIRMDAPLEMGLFDGHLAILTRMPVPGGTQGIAIGVVLTPAALRELKAGIAQLEKQMGKPIEDPGSPTAIQ